MRLDERKLTIINNIYLANHIVKIGDLVSLQSGEEGIIKEIEIKKNIPRFLIHTGKRNYWHDQQDLRAVLTRSSKIDLVKMSQEIKKCSEKWQIELKSAIDRTDNF